MGDDTSIRVKYDTWCRLKDRKEPGKSYDEIIRELLDESDESAETVAPLDR